MDWNNLTPIQLMALGAQTAFCNAVSCRECRIRISRGCENAPECHRWAIENPKETLKFYGVAEVDGEAALITLVDENNRLRKEHADQTAALAEALSAKEALEETEQAYFQEKGRAEGLLEALKIIQGSQT